MRRKEGVRPSGARVVFFLVPERDPAAAAAAASISHALDPIKQPQKSRVKPEQPLSCVSLQSNTPLISRNPISPLLTIT